MRTRVWRNAPVICLFAYVLCVPRTAHATIMEGFLILRNAAPNELVSINFDIERPPDVMGGLTSYITINATQPGASSEAIAGGLRDVINMLIAPGVARSSGSLVELQPGYGASFISFGSSVGLTSSIIEGVNEPVAGLFRINTDPNTGSNVLLADGRFGVTGPGGLNASFGAPAGTTSSELATLFADAMSIPGYTVELVDPTTVLFVAPTSGIVSFVTDGDGLEYDVAAVPEPSSLVLLGTGTLALLVGYGWRRRRAVAAPASV